MPHHPLNDARLKIEWANDYILDLEKAIASFSQSKPYAIIEESKPETGEKLIKVRLNAKPPADVQKLTGTITTNLRSSLDYLACQLAILNGRTTSGVEFPVAESRKEFESSKIQGKIKKLSHAARSAINQIEPYKRGQNSGIWALNELRRKDIHRTLIPMGHAATRGGPGYLRAGPTGSIAFNFPVWSMPDDEPVVLTVRGDDNQYDVNFAVDICLAEIDGFERQALLPFLRQSIDFIGKTVDSFDRAFFPKA